MRIRRVDVPDPGYYRVRLVKNGPWVPAQITFGPATDPLTGELLDRSPQFDLRIGGEPVDPSEWQRAMDRVHHWGESIDEIEHARLCAVRTWAREHAPDAPEASPERPIDIRKTPRLFHAKRGL